MFLKKNRENRPESANWAAETQPSQSAPWFVS